MSAHESSTAESSAAHESSAALATAQRSLYRRHRPRTFADVVGQEPVVRTLRHAVQREKVHHAYLFVGSRGTGKTSMAKILAACLNCERGPTVEPCGQCDSCRAIAAASSLDVIEMDAASNNSVDDIRELRESVAYAPVSGRRKVYILDEAHMLSTAAWNAFLKTLEEPPPNTVFVLATTEAQKVPATVVDRCHRFDFHRPTVEQIAGVVRRAADAEAVAIPPDAVAAIARAATGSFRDALGTLEQLITYSGEEIALDDVLAVLGVADARLLEQTVDAVDAGDARTALTIVAQCAEQGRDAAALAADIEVRARELLVVQTLGAVPAELSLTPDADAALAAQAERVAAGAVVRLLDELGVALEAVRAGADARTRLELALVKAAKPDVEQSVRALIDRVARLEAGERVTRGGAVTAEPNAAVEVAVASIATVPEPDARSESDAPSRVAERDAAPASADKGERVVDDVAALLSWWPAVVELVRNDNAMLSACIQDARPVDVKGEDLTVAIGAPFLKKKAEKPDSRAAVSAALQDVTGRRWRLSYELHDDLDGEADDASAPRSEDEWLERFKQEFDAEELTGDGERAGEEPVSSEQKGA